MPSGSRPTFRWNSRTARSVRSPKMPSSRPASNPIAPSRRCSALTSSPRNVGCRKYSVRSPSEYPASTSSLHVSGPTFPSTRSPRRCWNARTAASVDAPYRPSNSAGWIDDPRATSRTWTSRTSSPWSPRRMVVDVQLGYDESAGLLLCDLLNDRGDHMAGDAPVGPEIDENRRFGLEHLVLEIL